MWLPTSVATISITVFGVVRSSVVTFDGIGRSACRNAPKHLKVWLYYTAPDFGKDKCIKCISIISGKSGNMTNRINQMIFVTWCVLKKVFYWYLHHFKGNGIGTYIIYQCHAHKCHFYFRFCTFHNSGVTSLTKFSIILF